MDTILEEAAKLQRQLERDAQMNISAPSWRFC
jgi:hypothetical protein